MTVKKKEALQKIDETEDWAQSRLTKFPSDGVCLHTLEQLGFLRRAIQGEQQALIYVMNKFDLDIMVVKEEAGIKEKEIVDNLYDLAFYAQSL